MELCQCMAADKLVPVFAEDLKLFHKDWLLQTHHFHERWEVKIKHTLQTGEEKRHIWHGEMDSYNDTAGI